MRRLTAALCFALVAAGLFAAPASGASTDPKIVIVVGPVQSQTSGYLSYGNAAYTEARKYSNNVVKLFTPCATWSKVKAAMQGAAVVIYMGHGNGFPSPYRTSPWPYSQNGMGLNKTCNAGHSTTTYYGEYYMSQVKLAPNAIVLLHHLCYASGNSEPGNPEPTLSVAQKRADNYGAGFIKAGAAAVIAEGHGNPNYYLASVFGGKGTIGDMWKAAPTFHNHVISFSSTRSPGAKAMLDPESSAPAKFYRSIVGDLNLRLEVLNRIEAPAPVSASPFG